MSLPSLAALEDRPLGKEPWFYHEQHDQGSFRVALYVPQTKRGLRFGRHFVRALNMSLDWLEDALDDERLASREAFQHRITAYETAAARHYPHQE